MMRVCSVNPYLFTSFFIRSLNRTSYALASASSPVFLQCSGVPGSGSSATIAEPPHSAERRRLNPQWGIRALKRGRVNVR
jgi:hypothetical protein